MYNDPAGQYRFALPLGWAYDTTRSHLITVRFTAWNRPEETLTVRAIPTFAPASASTDEWYEALARECFPPRMLPFTRMQSGGMPAALAEAHESEPEQVHRRILVVRGSRLDIIAEHRVPEPSTEGRLSDALAAIGRTLDVPTNRFLPEMAEQQAVEGDLLRAQEAVKRQAWQEVLEPALSAQRAAQATYLYSVVAGAQLPEIPAIIALIDALTMMGQASGNLLPLRDAEQLARRAEYTLRHLQFVPPGRRRQIGEALSVRLSALAELHTAIAQSRTAAIAAPATGSGTVLLRLDHLLKEAQQAAETGQHHLAAWPCEVAIADSLTVFAALERQEWTADRLPPDALAPLAAAGVESPAEQAAILKRIVRRGQLDTLQSALTLLSHLRSLGSDVAGATEASEFLVTIARELAQPERPAAGGTIEVAAGQLKRLAFALIEHAKNLVDVEDEANLKDAGAALTEAESVLDEAGENGALQAWLCLVRASMLHSQRRLDGALEIIDRGLQAAAAEPESAAQHARELRTLKSQFLIHEHRLDEARELALEIVRSPEGQTPRDRIDRANHWLNLAIIQQTLGDLDAAAESLRQALRRALEVEPFGEETLRILMVAARGYMERDVALSHLLNLAAAATLDARRTTLGSDRFRIGFDEATRRREVYGDLVGRLVAFGAGAEAVAAADRSRARSLNELLVPPRPEQSTSPAPAPPPILAGEVRQALRQGAEYVLRAADAAHRRAGANAPLRADEVVALVRDAGAPALVIQPVRQQVALLLVKPSGEVEASFSPLSLDECLEHVSVVQQELRIHSVARGERAATAAPSTDEQFTASLARLSEALITPLADSLAAADSLLLVPYREFTLVPFLLLRHPDGVPLVDRHALSVVPSLATLKALRDRAPWTRKHPVRAYVAGDPAIAAKYRARGLGRLPAARADAEAVAGRLRKAGTAERDLVLRLDGDAHEASYRREARGCDLVHLSCHGQLKAPAYTSCLYFAPTGPYDGQLLAPEIADVKLGDALVFLSACQTGQGRATADGVVGLGRAYLEAGARAVIVSLWKVEDTASSVLARHFYDALLDAKQPQHAAGALRAAALATRDELAAGRIKTGDGQPLEPHPAYWAPFIVLGDGLSVRYEQGRDS
ncbi:MAG: CHAT domain-containing protein [Chloroflexi bacterium]|nr:CHAT domain-containing protein [Chloroflexota bacterium]